MKKGLIFMALCLCLAAVTVSADVVWSSAFDFDGSEITEPVVIPEVNQIGYSMALSSGTINKEMGVVAYPVGEVGGTEIFFTDDPNDEGTFSWNYLNNPQFVKNSNYTLKETIIAYDVPDVTYTRLVHILPEPAALLILGLVGAMFLRRHAKSLLIVLALVSLGSISANATTISVGKCFQMWPFERNVIINYTVSDCSGEEYINFYYTTDNGESSYDLRENGLLTGDVGPISANGNYRVVWTPDTETMASVKGKMKIGVDVFEPDPPGPSNYMIVDLSGGASASSYPVTYTDDIPEGGWNVDEYKTSKMVFRLISPGTFTMGSPVGEVGRTNSKEQQHEVTLTKSFYIGVFEVTQEQYKNLTGNYSPSYSSGNKVPACSVSFDSLRGSNEGAKWPASADVDSTSILGKLREKTSDLHFDLPTEAQWEYACRANTTTALNSGKNLEVEDDEDPNMNEVGRYDYSPVYGIATVGSYIPNSWGLYDMHGNAGEWCLDWWDDNNYESTAQTDPKGPTEPKINPMYGGYDRMYRSGAYNQSAGNCRSASRIHNPTAINYPSNGFRLVLVVE